MNISDVMITDVYAIELNNTVADAAQLMCDRNTGSLIVLGGDEVAGIITERDMVLGCLLEGHVSLDCPVSRHMTIISGPIQPEDDMGDAAIKMMDEAISLLPVVDGGKVVGMVFADDVSRAIEQDNQPQPLLT